MPISESQLDTWSHQGSVPGSAATYETIRNVLYASDSPFYSKLFTVFLQGSYGNDTNVYRDSDVDVVIRLDGTYYYDTTSLTKGAKASFAKSTIAATYGYDEFKADVLSWLQKKFGGAVVPGTKAIYIKGEGGRRDADVLVCAKYRRYRTDSNGNDENYDEGIAFFHKNGTRIYNFPTQHSDNCTTKHQGSSSWFKPTVRIYKNIRNRMVDENVIQQGIAPSYFVEGMLWNAPNSTYGTSYGSTFVATLNWLKAADKTKLVCANDLVYLVRDSSNVCWPTANFDTYISKLTTYWNNF